MPNRPEKRNESQNLNIRPERKERVIRGCDEQEADSARILRGKKTRGSGCGNDKGDVKNFFARNEDKTTCKKSISVKMEYLCKISREARDDGKVPIFTFGFDNMPKEFANDWFSVPADVFDTICGVLTAVQDSDLETAKRWLMQLR